MTNEGSNTLSVVDIATGTTTAVEVGKAPRKVVVQQTASAAAAASAAATKVSIAGFAFGPQAATVKAGDAITWSNDDGSPHTVTFRDGSPGAKSLSPGEAFTRMFDKAGTYDYFCSFHPYDRKRHGSGEVAAGWTWTSAPPRPIGASAAECHLARKNAPQQRSVNANRTLSLTRPSSVASGRAAGGACRRPRNQAAHLVPSAGKHPD